MAEHHGSKAPPAGAAELHRTGNDSDGNPEIAEDNEEVKERVGKTPHATESQLPSSVEHSMEPNSETLTVIPSSFVQHRTSDLQRSRNTLNSGGQAESKVVEKFPHIRGYRAFKLPPILDVKSLLKSQLAVVIYDSDEKCRNCTGLQLPGVLDELFSYNGPLSALFSEEAVSLYLWAPTARAVNAYIYKHPSGDDPIEIVSLKEEHGVWRTKGPKNWEDCYYVYEVFVYHPSTLQVESVMQMIHMLEGSKSLGQVSCQFLTRKTCHHIHRIWLSLLQGVGAGLF